MVGRRLSVLSTPAWRHRWAAPAGGARPLRRVRPDRVRLLARFGCLAVVVAGPPRRIGSPDLPVFRIGCRRFFVSGTLAGFPSGNLRSVGRRPAARVIHARYPQWFGEGSGDVRIDVTPLGAASRSVAAVARAVVDYLEGEVGDPGAGLFGGGVGGAARYYGDSPEGPGRWVGAGAAFQRLAGTVDRDAFTRILEGRHPETGARLITARGFVSAQPSRGRRGGPLRRSWPAALRPRRHRRAAGLTKTDVEDMIAAAADGWSRRPTAARCEPSTVDGDDRTCPTRDQSPPRARRATAVPRRRSSPAAHPTTC